MFNRVILIGRLGRDTEPRYMADGQRGVLNFSIATNRRWRDKEGNWQDTTQWHNIVYWGRNVRQMSEWLKKGTLVMVEGEIRYRQWEDKEGKMHDVTEIYAFRLLSLERRERDTLPTEPSELPETLTETPGAIPEATENLPKEDEDLPF